VWVLDSCGIFLNRKNLEQHPYSNPFLVQSSKSQELANESRRGRRGKRKRHMAVLESKLGRRQGRGFGMKKWRKENGSDAAGFIIWMGCSHLECGCRKTRCEMKEMRTEK